jgi:hypothetical protein
LRIDGNFFSPRPPETSSKFFWFFAGTICWVKGGAMGSARKF